ncbi:MAG: hypothetical protein A3F13_05760 [Gammaproteobacteria bacterium RIFCSPHIGHO2_12_FULL_40_19]|nr:MAG: hypothetical protein A3F13_05760 [Gammaproteobacteria bacterium RIFCSPHIGHO2_12_FULL_40_19]
MENITTSHSRVLLSKITASWEKRARVKHYLLPNETSYEIDKPDFIETLIPIKNSRTYLNLSDAQKNKILSYGWLAYNAKTIAIESKIISPVCYDIIDGHIPGADDNDSRMLISETLTDESYHVLLCHHAMAMTEKYRKINRDIFPNFDLIDKVIELENKYTEVWQKKLVRLSVAIVSEIFISDYLKSISTCVDIVTLNRETVRSHRMDEMVHSRIFTELSKKIYFDLSPIQKKFLSSVFHYPVLYFSSKELNVWKNILDHVCPESVAKIMNEIAEDKWFDLSNIDYSHLIMLTEEMGMKNFLEIINLEERSLENTKI